MKRGLSARLAIAFIGITSSILLIMTATFVLETHYHFSLYQQHQAANMSMDIKAFNSHVEQALIQSILWTFFIGIIIAVIVSLYVAKRLTSPLIQIKQTAEQMTKGNLDVRTNLTGNDEITDLGQSLNNLADQLQHQEHLRKTMTADVAHELRTPLTTLKSHMMAMIDRIWEPTPERLYACYEEIERLTHLVGDLGNLTELESPRFQLQLQQENLTSVVRQSIEVVNAAFMEKGVHLEFSDETPVRISIDRQRISQVITNLLSNALKFTPQGGVVKVWVKAEAHTAALIVQDTGIGIKENELPYVFERFYRGEKSRNRATGGAGIGLAIVKAIVEAHGGHIQLNSVEGEGTEAIIRFNKESSQDLQKY